MYDSKFENFSEIQHSADYMTKSHLRNVMQLAIFSTSSDRLYALNISKVQSFLIKTDIELLMQPSKNDYIIGMLRIKDEIISVVDFDKWVNEDGPQQEQKIIIVCHYNQKKIGIMVKNIIGIEEKDSTELRVPSSKDEKISYVTDVFVRDDNKTKMCIVFDAEKLLFDANISDNSSKTTIYDIDSFEIKPTEEMYIDSNKLVLVAEDSQIVIEKLKEFFTKIKLNFEIYENGQELLNRIDTLASHDIGLVITDIEMPIKNGYQVIKYIKEDSRYGNVPVLSLTSMTNQGVKDKVVELGAFDLINKSDLKILHAHIKSVLEDEVIPIYQVEV